MLLELLLATKHGPLCERVYEDLEADKGLFALLLLREATHMRQKLCWEAQPLYRLIRPARLVNHIDVLFVISLVF